jgi:uridine phosphorylase
MVCDIDTAIVKPLKTANAPQLGPLAFMISTATDLHYLLQLKRFDPYHSRNLFTSRLHTSVDPPSVWSITGPIVGAPYAVMVLESLIAWGAERILFLGWCGSISAEIRIGDILLPVAAIADEGTSRHYDQEMDALIVPDNQMLSHMRSALKSNGLPFYEKTVWSTDAIFRETPDKVRWHQSNSVAAVDMETSALFSAGRFRKVPVACVLVVSDDLSSLQWRPGFKDPRFIESRRAVCEVIAQLCGPQIQKSSNG